MSDGRREYDPGGLGFDPSCSTAVLVAGASHPFYPALDPLPETRDSVLALAASLSDRSMVGFGTVIPILDQTYPQVVELISQICKPLQDRSEPRNDCLLIYFAGHGLLSDDDPARLLLAVRNTHPDYIDDSALSTPSIKRIMARCKVDFGILMLDCCYAGKAIDESYPVAVTKSLESMARYVVSSSSARQRSRVSPGGRYTGFASALLDVLKDGLPDCGATIPFRRVIEAAASTCVQNKLPEPWFNFAGKASAGSDFAFVRNAKFRGKDVLGLIETEVLPLLDSDDQALLAEALKKGKQSAKLQKSIRQLDRNLYEMGLDAGVTELESDVVKKIIAIPAFREFYNTSKQVPSWELLSENTQMTVAANGDTHCAWVRRVRTQKKLHSVWAFMAGDRGFSGFEPLRHNFTVTNFDPDPTKRQNGRVVPLRLLDTEFRKELVFYIYPEVAEGTEVELGLEYHWPLLFAPLVENGKDYWEFKVMSAAPTVAEVETIFELPTSIGQLTVESDSAFFSGGIAVGNEENGRRSIHHKLLQVPSGLTVKLNLSLGKADMCDADL